MRGRSALVASALVLLFVLGVAAVRSLSPSPRPSASRPEGSARSEAEVPSGEAAPPAETAPAPTPSPAERRSSHDEAAPETAEAPSAEAEPAEAPAKGARRSTDELIAELSSTDDIAVHEAADALAERKAVRAIARLAAIDITKGPRAAPSVIDALGRLAASADPTDKRAATDRLLALLAQERARDAPESAGNVLQLYQALGETGDPRAAAALEAELLDPKVTLAAKTVIVDALVTLKQPSSVAALRTLQQSLAGEVPNDKMEASILRELSAAVDRALAALP